MKVVKAMGRKRRVGGEWDRVFDRLASLKKDEWLELGSTTEWPASHCYANAQHRGLSVSTAERDGKRYAFNLRKRPQAKAKP